LAALTNGVSRLENPLDSLDAQSCAAACRVLGAEIKETRENGKLTAYTVRGRKPGGAPAGGAAAAPLVINVGNSGTTLFLGLAAAALGSIPVTFTGDEQIARRGAAPLLDALRGLGIAVESSGGCTPITVRGPWKGGRVSVSCPTSQYLSALLLAAPLAPAGTITVIDVPLLNEKPYVEMTLSYLKSQGIYSAEHSVDLPNETKNNAAGPRAESASNPAVWGAGGITGLKLQQGLNSDNPCCTPHNAAYPRAESASNPAATLSANSATDLNLQRQLNSVKPGLPRVAAAPDFSRFCVTGGAAYTPMNGPVPGDFSSAAFPAAAAASSGGSVTLLGLDPDDTQGDKRIFEYLAQMGCNVAWEQDGGSNRVTVSRAAHCRAAPLRSGVFDLNATPDMLPVMAALAAYAEGTTELVNAAHARIKETDRVAVMAAELAKLGVRCEERPDGLVIHGRPRAGNASAGSAASAAAPLTLDGRGDHRVVMALACAALGAEHPVAINGAEAADITYPGFLELLQEPA
jgi:5-enolpyruvylshikimate-3-phosphate synthase